MNEEKNQNQKINQGGHQHNRHHKHYYNGKNKGQNAPKSNNAQQAVNPQKEQAATEKSASPAVAKPAQNNNSPKQSGHHHKPYHKHHNHQKNHPSPSEAPQEKTKSESAEVTKSEAIGGSTGGERKPQNKNGRQHNNKGRTENTAPEKTAPQESVSSVNSTESSFGASSTSGDLIFGAPLFQNEKKARPIKASDEPIEPLDISDDVLFGTSHLLYVEKEIEGEAAEIVGIRYKCGGKIYYFDSNGIQLTSGEFAIVDTARGIEFGEVCLPNRKINSELLIHPLRKVIRKATKEDIEHHEQNKKKEADAFNIGLEKIKAHKLDMKLVEVQYEFDNSKLLFYFTSAGRVDFRELVRDLASVFKTRIELRQIGIRDEAKMLGGIGMCGRSLCCSKYLSNFAQVSIKMAKEQGLSLNSNKISGNCGRLMCCLNFENQVYLDEIKITPMPGSIVKIGGQRGTVVEANPLTGMLKVHLTDAPEGENVSAHRDTVTIISRKLPETLNESAPENEVLE
jgi:cell fate regulator YaaT (PSP1 superfamily)